MYSTVTFLIHETFLGQDYKNRVSTYSLSSVQELFKVIHGLLHLLFEQLMVGLDLNHPLTEATQPLLDTIC